MKFEPAPTPSRCHAWKNQVSPGMTATTPAPWGNMVRGNCSENSPIAPVLLIWLGRKKRPMAPPRQRLPLLAPPAFGTKPSLREVMKMPNCWVGSAPAVSVKSSAAAEAEPDAEMVPMAPVEFRLAWQ